MKKEVKIKVKGVASAPLDDFNWFQGELKSLSEENFERLKRSILKLGFSFAINVWINPEGQLMIIDGHQRVLTLRAMKADGYAIPYIPYDVTEADTYEQAKEKVLAGASQYGEVQHLGVAQFIQDTALRPFEMDKMFRLPGIEITNLPMLTEIDVSAHTRNIEELKNTTKELSESEFQNFEHKCPRCNFEFDGVKK